MKILHINDKLEVAGGVEVYLREILPVLTDQGIDAWWIALKRFGDEVHITSKEGEWNWIGQISELAKSPIADWIDEETILHVHSLSEQCILDEFFRLAPVVRHMHEPRMVCPGQGKFWAKTESICTKPFGLHCLWHAYTERCCNRHPKRLSHQFRNTKYETGTASHLYARVITNSDFIRNEALQAGFSTDKLEVLPYFTELTPEPRWELDGDPVITFAGRLSRTKGVHCLLRAFAEVIRDHPTVNLHILGSGSDEQDFFQLAEGLDLESRVHFLGWADKTVIDKELTQATVVAFPSIYPEAFGITGIEAMMRGKPVVAFDVGGVTDWLDNDRTGIAVPVKDVHQFAAGLRKLLKDDELRESMGKAAREDAITKFNPRTHLEKLLPIYKDCLAKK